MLRTGHRHPPESASISSTPVRWPYRVRNCSDDISRFATTVLTINTSFETYTLSDPHPIRLEQIGSALPFRL